MRKHFIREQLSSQLIVVYFLSHVFEYPNEESTAKDVNDNVSDVAGSAMARAVSSQSSGTA